MAQQRSTRINTNENDTMKLSREEMIQALWKHDLKGIREDMANGDTDYLCAILHGDGFTQYNNLTDQQLLVEVHEYGLTN